jgi:S1-C subfamily serine protease
VNIICYAPPLGTLRSISASGVIIDSRGIIVTDAHVAQYFLLADRGVSCVIRTGGPATPAYKASLMFISSAWVSANANVLGEPNPSGTGQYDFAFLAITGSATSTPLPTSFPYVPFSSEAPSIGTPVVIASYAAQYLAPSQILSALFPTVVFGSIKDLFTFAINSVDVFALGSSAAAQEGSSGGGVTDAQGQLVGVLTTSATNTTTGTRSLNAITTTYIELEYAAETGQSFYTLLSQSPAVNVANFAPQMPALEALVTKNLH